jgi:hypothetical protein
MVSLKWFTIAWTCSSSRLIENIWTHECQRIPEMQIWWNHNRSYQSRNCFQMCSGFG